MRIIKPVVVVLSFSCAIAFSPLSTRIKFGTHLPLASTLRPLLCTHGTVGLTENRSGSSQRLQAASNDNDNETTPSWTKESDQLVVGVAGTAASSIMLYSEFVLSQTGCGLPAGPLGLVGAVEGISYLSVVALGGYSLYQKVTTGSGLPAGKYGLQGLAQGLAFLALFAGVVVLTLQVTNYGYIPNAVPMEGGMCQ